MFQPSLLASYTEYFKDDNGNKHYDYPARWTAFAQDGLASVFLWFALALVVVLVAVGLFVRFKKPEKFKQYFTVALSLAVGYAVTVIVTMLSLEFFDMNESDAVFLIVLVPSVVLALCVLLGAAAIYVGTLCEPKVKKITVISALSVIGAAFVALFVCLIVYFATGTAEENNGVSISITENVALCISTVVLAAAIALIAVFCGKGEKRGFDSKSISYAAVCVSLSFALSYIRPVMLPQGGSVTIASLLPLMCYSYMFGVRKGVFAGFAYGLLQAVQDPWIIHPAQFLLDYPVAFAGIGVAGLFAGCKKLDKIPQVQFALGAIVAGVFRFAAHVLSGVFAFSEYSTLDNVWIYSLAYNSFVFVDLAVVIVVGVIVFCSRSFVKQARKFRTEKPKPADSPLPEETN